MLISTSRQRGPGCREHRGVQLRQDAVPEGGAAQLRFIEGDPVEFALGEVRAAQLQAVGSRAAVPDAVVPFTALEVRRGVIAEVLEPDR